MAFDPGISRGTTIDNERLREIFQCSSQGGMRRSLKTNTLLLISNHVESIYDDRWVGNIFHYTGMGTRGDQALDFMQNKTLAESGTNGVEVHLFEVDESGQYRYEGRVALSGEPYREVQPDEDRKDRHVWVFPLRLLEEVPPVIPGKSFRTAQERRARKARRLGNEELLNRARLASKQPGQREVLGTEYERNPYVAEAAKRRAKGCCELCNQSAPFTNSKGEPYLETHHIVWLARKGDDSIANTVALCPNCHRRMHVLDLGTDKEKLVAVASEKLATE